MGRSVFSQSWHNVAELRPRLLPHARLMRHVYRGQPWYVLQDPTTGRHHRMSPAAYAFVSRMDGNRSVQQLWNEACSAGGESIPTQNEIVELLSQLHAQDLLYSDATPDSAELLARFRKQRRQRWKQRIGNPMSLRVPLIDPDAFLGRWVGRLAFLFGPMGAALWLATVVPAVVIATRHWDELTGNLSDRVLAADNLLLIGLLFIPVKALHELGHGFATKHWGGSVREMGLMFLVFAPVPYVDSSSANAFQSKYRRALVGAAGMIVETFLAALALYVWVLVEPGMLRAVAFNVMLIAGFSTLLVNGNPLLRFDGYYILADLIEIPNLAQRGQKYWTYLSDRYLFGARTIEPPAETPNEKRWIAPYTVASWIYRIVITVSIIVFVASEFFIFGVLLALWAGAMLFVTPIYKAIKHIATSGSLQRQRRRAVGVSLALAATAAGLVCFVPLPLRTQAEGVIWLPERSLLRAGSDGFFDRWLVEPGKRVEPRMPLLLMTDPQLDAEVKLAKERLREVQARFDAEQFVAPARADVIRQQLDQERRQLDRLLDRQAHLVVTSEAAGSLLVPQHRDMPGAHYRKGDLLGYVLDRGDLVARVVVEQDDVDLVRRRLRYGQLRLVDDVGTVLTAGAIRETPGGVTELPSAALTLEGGGHIAVDPQDGSGLKTLERTFLFDIALPPSADPRTFGSRVFVRFDHQPEPLARQWYRRLRQLFLSRFNV